MITTIRDPDSYIPAAGGITEVQRQETLLITGALQNAILNSANFSSIATDEKGVIQIFNVGAERMLGYAAVDVMNKITPADISDPHELIVRAKALSVELGTLITPGFEALVFKASHGIEDIYELTYIRKDGSRFPAVVSVTALRDAHGGIIGYLLIGTDNTARKQIEAEQKQLGQRLRDFQFYTRSLFESNIDALMTSDPEGIITDVNKQMESLTGCTRDELIGAPFKNYFTDQERAEAAINLVLTERKVINYELTARARDGKETVVSYNAATLYDRDRRLQGVFAAARDITERKQVEEKLHISDIALKAISQGVIITKSDQTILSVNDAFVSITGYSQEEIAGQNCRFLQGQLSNPQVIDAMRLAIKNATDFSGEILNYRKDGTTFWNYLTISPVRDDLGKLAHFIGVTRDITEHKLMEDQVRQLAFYDPLTKLANRRLLNDRLSQAINSSKRSACYGALMFLDLDNFKPLNDTHGHVVGDLLLIDAAARVKSCVREVDTVARFGGDEFVVMLSELDVDKAASKLQALNIAEKIRAALFKPYLLDINKDVEADATVEHHCSASIGVVVFLNHEGSQDDLLEMADTAMYQAKEDGRNQIRFYSEEI
ncbi:MAG: PAS domain S-box protein [Methylococcaceae bacterium]|nr:PAS domain S-box protein [Methylococcaceae bacterium]MDP3904310.1 PAS domain S-box protein [Methylococcaceae bacterium]